MSIYGDWITTTIANGGTTTAEVNLGRDFELLEVEIPTITSAALNLQVSKTPGGTFQNLGNSVTTETITGGYTTVWRLGGFQFIKIVSSNAQGAERTFNVRGIRN